MIYWLVDNKTSLLVVFAAIALVLGVLLLKTKDRRCVIALISVGVLAVVVAILPFFVETDRQKIESAIRDMAANVRTNDLNRIFSHVSEDFRQGELKSKKEFRNRAEAAMRQHGVNGAEVWDFVPVRISRSEKTGVMSFHFKPKGKWEGEYYWRCEAEFTLDADDQWRMVDFKLFKAQSEERVPLPF